MHNPKQIIKTIEDMIPYYSEMGFNLKSSIRLAVENAVKIDQAQRSVLQSIVEGN